MNDRFKFRVWDNVEEEYVEDLDIIRLTQYGKFVFNNAENNTEPELNPKRFIFEQCTGLKDKNGELIFEGDIVRSENFFGIVEFGKYRVSYDSVNLGFYIKWGKKQSELRKDIFYWHETYGLKVVGNIHEDIDEYIGKHNIEREEE